MSKVFIIGEKKIEFPVEIRKRIDFNDFIIVLYRNDKEIPNNIHFFDLNGNLLYTINDIVKAKIPKRIYNFPVQKPLFDNIKGVYGRQ